MQEMYVLLSLTAVFAVALVSPGPDVALVVRTAVHQGRRAGILSALGLASGILVHGTLVLTGVSLLLRHTPWLFSLLQGVGALYLGWLGVGALRAWFARGEQVTALPAASAKLAYLGPWLRGLATNLFNPKALVFFLALLSSLVPTDMSIPGKVAVAAILFGLGFAWFALLSVLLTQPAWQARLLRAAPLLDAVCGVVFLLVALGIGVGLLRQV